MGERTAFLLTGAAQPLAQGVVAVVELVVVTHQGRQ
jgi:hypothetical protein